MHIHNTSKRFTQDWRIMKCMTQESFVSDTEMHMKAANISKPVLLCKSWTMHGITSLNVLKMAFFVEIKKYENNYDKQMYKFRK